MFHIFLALIFLIKLSAKPIFSAPKFLSSHYGKATLVTLRSLERAKRNVIKWGADIAFLKKCVLYNLTPVFLKFKLFKNAAQNIRKTRSYRKSLLLYEISQHEKSIKLEKKKIQWLTSTIKNQISIFAMIVVNKFLIACEKQQLL